MEKNLHLLNDIEQLSKLTIFIDQFCEEANLSPDIRFNLELVLEEAVTNAILYAYPNEHEQPIDITAGVQNSEIMISIKDCGVPFNPLTEVPEADTTSSVEDRKIGGLGVFLIKQIMDTVTYQYIDKSNVLTMKKSLPA